MAELGFQSSDEDEAQVDVLSKTLPHGFHFSPGVTEEEEEEEEEQPEPRDIMSKRERGSHGHSHSLSTCGVPMDDMRNHPMAEGESNLMRMSTMGLGRSDPSILGQSESDHSNRGLELSHATHRRSSPHRTKSFNIRKTAACGMIGSPSIQRLSMASCGSPWSSPRNTPVVAQPFPDVRLMRPDSDRGRRYSTASVTSGYQTENTGSPSDISSFGSHGDLHHLPYKPTDDDVGLIAFQKQLSSNAQFGGDNGGRRRGRSLSPPHYRSPRNSFNAYDNEVLQFKKRFRKAKQVMEEKLEKFLDEFSDVHFRLAAATLSFIKSQVLKHAEDLLEAAKSNKLDGAYCVQLSQDIEKLLEKLYEDSGIGYATERKDMTRMIKNFLAIISQPTRLLECMEINPEQYLLSDPEALKFSLQSPSHMPFILSHLNLTIQAAENKNSHISNVRNVTLNDFDRIKLISQGAYSSVHLARLRQTGERFALKRVNKQRMLMKKQVEQVFHERDILSYTENPFVVGFLCTFQTKNHLYYVMEFVEGGDLASMLKDVHCLSVETARLYFAESVLALEYIHSLGIIHRDLKPDNFLITSEGHIKLTDFGLSKVGLASATATMVDDHMNRDRQFKDSKVLGTPDYIAPEVILGQPYGFAVDWWSMGVILYEMLLGFTPFCSTTVEDLFEEITNENMKIDWPAEDDEEEPPPKDAQYLVESLLKQNPDERLGSHTMGGVQVVKSHEFFEGQDWNNLLRRKAELFVPELQDEEDTSYFDARTERYNNNNSSGEDSEGETNSGNNPFIKFDSSSRRMSILLSDWSLNSSYENDENKRKASGASIMAESEEGSMKTVEQEQGSDSEELVTAIDDVICDDIPEVARSSSVPKRTLSVTSTVESGEMQDETIIRHGRSNSETPPLKVNQREKEKSDRNRRSRSIDHVVTEDITKHTSGGPSGNPYTSLSPRSSVHLTAPYSIRRRDNRFGFTFKPIRVYFGDTDNYWLHHVIDHVDKGGPAEEAGLRPDLVITYVNGEKVTGLTQPQVWQLILTAKNNLLMHATPIEETSIRKGGKKRTATLGRRIARRFNLFKSSKSSSSSVKLKNRSKTIFRRRSSKAKDRDWIPPRAPSPEAGVQSSSRDPKRSESIKEKFNKLKIHTSHHSPMRRNTTPASPSPLTRTPSPTSLQLAISKDRSNSTSPLTHIGSPTSSPTGSQMHFLGETPPDSPPKHSRKPERSSSLFVKSPQHESPWGRPERHSLHEQVNPASSTTLLTRRTSGSDLSSGGKAHLSPLLKHTRSPETKKKNRIKQNPPSPNWGQAKEWFDKQ